MNKEIDAHPFADLFPLMQGIEFEALKTDIKTNGQIHPIIIQGGLILDGRNRYRACRALKIKPLFADYTGPNALDYVISVNLERRHLNESARAMVAETLANLQLGANQHRGSENLPTLAVSQAEAAKRLNVSDRLLRHAKVVKAKAIPRIVERVALGDVPVSLGAKLAKLPVDQQRQIAEADDSGLRYAQKTLSRIQRETDLAEATRIASAQIGSTLYNVIYADPPWRFEPRSRKTGLDRSADNHYPTMTVAEICALEVPSAADAALFLWATAPMLLEAIAVLQAWGFTYKSHYIWVKDKIGTGYWGRNRHEILLIGTKGKIPAPSAGTQPESVIVHATERHSHKPAVFAEMIEEMFPHSALLEMFAREPRVGWDTWGNEAIAA